MRNFKVGDSVSILEEEGAFILKEIQTNKVVLLDEHGFERYVEISSVVRRRQIVSKEIVLKERDFLSESKSNKVNFQIPEIDLHIESLLSESKGLTPHEKFLVQIDCFKRFTNEMIRKKVKKFRVIHGIGEGKLKTEIYALIQTKSGIQMHDDNYVNGKVGASLIEMQVTKVSLF